MITEEILDRKKREILENYRLYLVDSFPVNQTTFDGALNAMDEYAIFYYITNGTGILPEPKIVEDLPIYSLEEYVQMKTKL